MILEILAELPPWMQTAILTVELLINVKVISDVA